MTVLSSAFLLFQVQPIVAKQLLPSFGGAPAVWTTCMVFFQVLLLFGYLYAHLLAKISSGRKQVAIHIAVAGIALFFGEVLPQPDPQQIDLVSPQYQILSLLLGSVGIPYFLLATTGPLLQRWFAIKFPTRSPYRLYALSNLGSLTALLSYPVLVEPTWDLQQQAFFWKVSFFCFAVFLAAAGLLTVQGRSVQTEQGSSSAARISDWLLWCLLAALPSALLLATTNQICQDIAVVPFLWVFPLALYLVSFILTFESAGWYSRRWCLPTLALAILLTCDQEFTGPKAPTLLALSTSLICFFLAALTCHGELIRRKPSTVTQLTSFYLAISVGGALGGIFVGIIAPLIFSAFYELQLTLFLVVATGIGILLHESKGMVLPFSRGGIKVAAAVVLGLFAFGLGKNASRMTSGALEQTRNFFGTLRVSEENPENQAQHRRLQYHGRIVHGFQYQNPPLRSEPNGYYGRESGVGRLLATYNEPTPYRFGLIGLGIGTLAAYAKPGDHLTFFEINPAVIDQTARYFSYVKDSLGATSIILGDARISLELAPPYHFDVLVLDAFSGDAVPSHLLTIEAFRSYQDHLAEDGVIAIHISNTHLDLKPLLRAVAAELQLAPAQIEVPRDDAIAQLGSSWFFLTRDQARYNHPNLAPFLSERNVFVPATRLWTDSFSNLWSLLR
jgi:hypothetical protein